MLHGSAQSNSDPLVAPESNPGAQIEEKSGSLLVLALLVPLVGAAAGLLGTIFRLVLEAADRFRDALIAASSRAAPAPAVSQTPHSPSIPETSLGQIIRRKVGNLAVRSSPSDLQSGVAATVAVNSLCRHALSKDATGQVFPTRQAPCFQAQNPSARRKFLRVRTSAYFSLQQGCHKESWTKPLRGREQHQREDGK